MGYFLYLLSHPEFNVLLNFLHFINPLVLIWWSALIYKFSVNFCQFQQLNLLYILSICGACMLVLRQCIDFLDVLCVYLGCLWKILIITEASVCPCILNDLVKEMGLFLGQYAQVIDLGEDLKYWVAHTCITILSAQGKARQRPGQQLLRLPGCLAQENALCGPQIKM